MKYPLILAATILAATPVWAEDCPPGATSCIVVTMTPQEVQTLTNPGGVFDNAEWASRSTMTPLIDAWKKKLASAPAGTVKTPDESKTTTKPAK